MNEKDKPGAWNTMNTQQKILSLGALLIGLAVLFPPFEFRGVVNLGYGFLFVPPTYSGRQPGSVNVSLLATEIVAVCLVIGAAYMIAGVKLKQDPR